MQSEGLHSIKNMLARCTPLKFSGKNYFGYQTVFFLLVDLIAIFPMEYEKIIIHPVSEKNTRQIHTNPGHMRYPCLSRGFVMPPLPLLLGGSHTQADVSS